MAPRHRKERARTPRQIKALLAALAAAIVLFLAVNALSSASSSGPSMPAAKISGAASAPHAMDPHVSQVKQTPVDHVQQGAVKSALAAQVRKHERQHHQAVVARQMSAAEKAVAFAYVQLGCPYVWGGTGPCSSGWDCSGLVQAAWAYAGVSIPRTTWDQLAGLPRVPVSAMRPGDLLILLGGDHVGMYVGHGYMIDSPQPGRVVERVPIAGWVMGSLVAVLQP